MKRIIVAIPHSHSWFWTQTCVASLHRYMPVCDGFSVKVIVVDNSPWSPAIRGIRETPLGKLRGLHVIENYKSNKFHASALDCIVERLEFDYLMALETDVLVLRPGWLQWFMDQMKDTDYAVGMWHHEQFVNPSCTLYQGHVLRDMNNWCKKHPDPDVLRWGHLFDKTTPLDANLPARLVGMDTDQQLKEIGKVTESMLDWIAGPFAEKRGWPAGTILKEPPSGQLKGAGWYEPGQQLHHWAVEEGYTYTVCKNQTTVVNAGLPLQTLYGADMPDPQRQLDAVELFGNAETAHLWGGTRALDILKHPVTCEFVKNNTPMWLAREARFWRQTVQDSVREKTLDLIRKYGWHTTGQGSDHVSDRDRAAAHYVQTCYAGGGVEW